MSDSVQPMILLSGDVSRSNPAFDQKLGYTADELDHASLLERIHADDRGEVDALLRATSGSAEARLRSRAGDWLPFDWRVEHGAEGPAILGLFRGEDALHSGPSGSLGSQHCSLAETLEAMVHIVEAKNPGMLCSILLVDDEKERVSVGAGPSLPREYNAAVEGLRIGPAVGSCGTAAFWNIPIVVTNIAEDPLWKNLRDAAALAGVSACWSHPILATNGETLGAMALYDREPRAPTENQLEGLEIAARMVGLAVERGRLEEQLRQAAKMEALGVLAGGVAHDFNNMLAAVMGNAELAMTTLAPGADARPMLQEIVTASLSATELCNQMLAYAGRGALSAEPLELNAIVRELGGLLQVALSKKASLEYELSATPLGVVGDRGQLRQVIMNLITNSSDAIGNEAGRIRVATEVVALHRDEAELLGAGSGLRAGDFVRLTVTDTGAGMSPETRSRIFDPFFTTKSGGRGLGLAAVQGIVRGHGGAIHVESTLGTGTTTAVLLPRSELPHDDARPPVGGSKRLAGTRILVVDDEPKVLAVLGDMLSNAGLEVLRAGDGQEAIDIFRANADDVDCVLLDLSMPKLDGEEVFAELRRIRDDVRVVLSSGFTEQEILDRFRGAGLAGTVQKPARMDVLLDRISEALGLTAAS